MEPTPENHPVFPPLDQKISDIEKQIRASAGRISSVDQRKAAIVDRIAELQKELARIEREQRDTPSFVERQRTKLANLKDLRQSCCEDPLIAQAAYLQLLRNRQKS